MEQIKAVKYPSIYQRLNININKLGCVMLKVGNLEIPELNFYYANDPERFWINGPVARKGAHCTLRFGLLTPGNEQKENVDEALKGWTPEPLEISHIDHFPSHIGEPVTCLVAKLKVTENLLEGHLRLGLLPNISTFSSYLPHVTLAYVHKETPEKLKADKLILATALSQQKLVITGLNYGDEKLV